MKFDSDYFVNFEQINFKDLLNKNPKNILPQDMKSHSYMMHIIWCVLYQRAELEFVLNDWSNGLSVVTQTGGKILGSSLTPYCLIYLQLCKKNVFPFK